MGSAARVSRRAEPITLFSFREFRDPVTGGGLGAGDHGDFSAALAGLAALPVPRNPARITV
jgi:hypothetical protein